MKLRVRLFARARELAGADHVAVELPSGATVADLRARLAARYTRLAELVKRCAVAVDAEFAGEADVLKDDAEIALLPPVSGG